LRWPLHRRECNSILKRSWSQWINKQKIRFGDFELIAPIESYNLSPRGFDLNWQQNLTKGLQAELQSHRDVGSIIIEVPPNATLQLIAVIAAGLQSKAKVRCFLRIER